MDKVLSESLGVKSRDPFEESQRQYKSKGKVLSSSPVNEVPAEPELPKLEDHLSKLGISHGEIAMNDIGKIQLVGRLRDKFGDNYAQNPDALKALDVFDQNLKAKSGEATSSMNKALANANRTLASLLGRKP